MPFPSIDPVLVYLGPFAIRWYALAYVVAVLLGWRYTVALSRNAPLWGSVAAPLKPHQADDLVVWLAAGIIIGGRLGAFLLYEPSVIWQEPLQVLSIWDGGMSFHGGLLGVVVAMASFARLHHIDVVRLGDLIAPCAPIGIFFGRIANFINGELWGRPTTAPWGIIFPNAGSEPRHPSQLYEAALEGVLLFIVLRWATHRACLLRRRGMVVGLFLLLYAVFRSAVELLREPDPPLLPHGLTMGMLLSVPLALAGALFIARALLAERTIQEQPAPALAGE